MWLRHDRSSNCRVPIMINSRRTCIYSCHRRRKSYMQLIKFLLNYQIIISLFLLLLGSSWLIFLVSGQPITLLYVLLCWAVFYCVFSLLDSWEGSSDLLLILCCFCCLLGFNELPFSAKKRKIKSWCIFGCSCGVSLSGLHHFGVNLWEII